MLRQQQSVVRLRGRQIAGSGLVVFLSTSYLLASAALKLSEERDTVACFSFGDCFFSCHGKLARRRIGCYLPPDRQFRYHRFAVEETQLSFNFCAKGSLCAARRDEAEEYIFEHHA